MLRNAHSEMATLCILRVVTEKFEEAVGVKSHGYDARWCVLVAENIVVDVMLARGKRPLFVLVWKGQKRSSLCIAQGCVTLDRVGKNVAVL